MIALRFPSAMFRITATPMNKVLALKFAFLAIRLILMLLDIVDFILQIASEYFSWGRLMTIGTVSLQLRDVEDVMQFPPVRQDKIVGNRTKWSLDVKRSNLTRQEFRCSHLKL